MESKEQSLREELARIEAEIEEHERALPAHTVRPAMILKIEALEERRDSVKRQIADLEKPRGGG